MCCCRELESENANLQEEYKHLKASSSSFSPASTATSATTTDAEDILSEAKLLREHRDRLESRMRILEQHNSQLVTQLSKLKLYLDDVSRQYNSAVHQLIFPFYLYFLDRAKSKQYC